MALLQCAFGLIKFFLLAFCQEMSSQLFEDSQGAGGYQSVAALPQSPSDFGRQRLNTDVFGSSPVEFDMVHCGSWPGATAPVSKLRPPPPAAPRRRPSTLEPMEVPALALPASAKKIARSVCSNSSTMDGPDNGIEEEVGVFAMEPAIESDDEHAGLEGFMMAPAVESDDDFNDDGDRGVEFDMVELDDTTTKREPKRKTEPLNEDGGSPPMGMSPVLTFALQRITSSPRSSQPTSTG